MIQLFSGCKINTLLYVGGKRPDGYHEIHSIFLPLAFPHDRIYLSPGSKPGLSLSCDPPIRGENILSKAYAMFADASGYAPALELRLKKGIPPGSGLGGGSGDAATLLKWLNSRADAPLSHSRLSMVAAAIGADVPFFLINRAALVTGKGEILKPLAYTGTPFYIIMFWPAIAVSSAWAFHSLDAMREDDLTKSHAGNKNISPFCGSDTIPDLATCYNDLERPVFRRYPELLDIKKFFLDGGAFQSGMSGSGSTIFGLFHNWRSARKAIGLLRGKRGCVFLASLRPDGM